MELIGRYSNLCQQGERLHELRELKPLGPRMSAPEPRQVQKRLNQDHTNLIVARYLDGFTVYELADQFEIHRVTVSRILDRAGVPRRLRSLSPAEITLATRLYEGGHSLAEIGVQLGRDPETIRQTLMRSGTQIRKRKGWH